jgi:hypothetical protein
MKTGKTARACPKTVSVSAQSMSFGTGSKKRIFCGEVKRIAADMKPRAISKNYTNK